MILSYRDGQIRWRRVQLQDEGWQLERADSSFTPDQVPSAYSEFAVDQWVPVAALWYIGSDTWRVRWFGDSTWEDYGSFHQALVETERVLEQRDML